MANPEHVIIIPGLLRCVDNVFFDFMDSAAGLAQIFVITDKDYAPIAKILANRYDAVCIFMEDAIYDFGVRPDSFHGTYNQVLKLEVGLAAVLAWEADHDHQFKYIHKIRTDLLYSSGFVDYIKPLLLPDHPKKCLLNQHDCNFSGLRTDALMLAGISTYLEKFMHDERFFYEELTKIDVDALRSGDVGPFPGTFPVGVISSKSEADAFHYSMRERFSSYIDAALNFAIQLKNAPNQHDLPGILRSQSELARTYIGQYFPFFPEHIYARYLNSRGLSAKAYSTPYLPLRHARFATTVWTKLIFDQIQESNFSFLDDNLQWENELNLFRSAGGIEGKFAGIIASIDLNSLSDSQCFNLYSLMDCLDCAPIVRFWPSFVASLASRGLGMPSSIQKLLDQ